MRDIPNASARLQTRSVSWRSAREAFDAFNQREHVYKNVYKQSQLPMR
jgi:hypothetical protein